MRALSTPLAGALVLGSLLLFIGGLGPLMWFGAFGESYFPVGHWFSPLWTLLAYAYVPVWLGSIVCAALCWRGLGYAISRSLERPWHWADVTVIGGHLMLVLALVHLAGVRLWGADLFYGLTMLSALAYAIGLAALALTFHSRADRPQAAGG